MRIGIATYALILVLAAATAWPGPATDQLKETLDRLIAVLNDPALKAQCRATQRETALHDVLKQRFDEEAFAKKALGGYWKTITPDEREAFIPLFAALLEKTYFERIDAELARKGSFSSESILYVKESVKDSSAQVSTRIETGEGDGVPVIYRLRREKEVWQVIDMKIEGVIISKNYRAQFSEILARQPMSKLLEKLRDKLGLENRPESTATP